MINPEYSSRFGTINDLGYIEQLLVDTKNYRQNTHKIWSYPFADNNFDISVFMKSIEKMISDETQTKNKIALVFDKEENIKCIAVGQFWNTIRSWRQCIVLCNPNNSIFNAVDNGIADSSTLLVSHAESIGYYSYDFIVANPKTTSRWNRMRQQIPIIKDRYEFFDEAIIPAGTTPSHPRYRQMMRYRTWNVDLLYRIGYLKNQYRNDSFLISL